MKLLLFNEDISIQMDSSKNIEYENIDVEKNLEAIIEITLSIVEKLFIFHGTTSLLQSVKLKKKNKPACNNISVSILYQLKLNFATFNLIQKPNFKFTLIFI